MKGKGKPLWKVILQSIKNKNHLRTYYVIAPEMEITARGIRSNEWAVREICDDKGFKIYSSLFLGFVSQIPDGALDLNKLNEKSNSIEVVGK